MSKNLLVEISRIQELMGIQNKGLIMEQGIIPFVKMFLKKGVTFEKAIDDAADLLVSSGKMSRAEVDEAIEILKNEKTLVDDINRTYKKIPTINDNVRIQTYIDDLIKKSGSKNLDNFIQKITTLTQKEVDTMTSEGVKWLLANQKWEIITRSFNEIFVPDIIKLLEGGLNSIKVKLNLTDFENAFSSFCKNAADDFVEKYKNTLQKMYDEKTVDKKTGKVFIKTKDELDKLLLSADNEVGEPVFEYFKKKFHWRQSDEISSLIEDYKKLNKIDDSAPSISKPIYGKNNPFEKVKELDEEGKSFFRELDGTGESIFNGKVTDESPDIADEVKKELFPPAERSKPPAKRAKFSDYIDEGVEESATEIISRKGNPFGTKDKGGYASVEINYRFFEAFAQLKYIATLPETTPRIKETLVKIAEAIYDGKNILGDLSQEDVRHLHNCGLRPEEVSLIETRLRNAVPTKMGWLGEFFWRWVEPIIKGRREFLLNFEYFRNLANKFGAKLPDRTVTGYFDDFLKTLELKLTKMNVKTGVSYGDVKQLKDKFIRLRSELGLDDRYYAQLWTDLNSYVVKNLQGQEALNSWGQLVEKLMQEKGSGWRFTTWKEMINDSKIINMAEDAKFSNATKEQKDTLENILNASVLTFAEKTTKGILEWISKNGGGNLFSYFIGGTFRTPKEMMQYMLERGYASKAYGRFNIKMTAGGANYLEIQLYKYIFIPLAYSALLLVVEGLGESISRLDIDGKDFFDNFFNTLYKTFFSKDLISYFINSDSFKSQYPDWYKFIEPLWDGIGSSPSNKLFKRFIEGQFIVDLPTPEEQAHKDLDTEIDKLELNLEKDGSVSGRKLLEYFKQSVINNNLPDDLEKNIIENMSLDSRLDPKIKEEAHNIIKEAFKNNEGITAVLKELKEGVEALNKIRKSTPIDNILVTARGIRYKLFEDPKLPGSGYIYFYKPKYSEIIKNPETPKTAHNLNELEF